MSEWLDLGHGVEVMFYTRGDVDQAGLIERHECVGERVGGSVPFDVPGVELAPESPRWTVEQLDPLTISPSVLCRDCGLHGWIRNGRWVPA